MTVHLPIIEIRIVECRGRAQDYKEFQDMGEGRLIMWRGEKRVDLELG
jgi:hypothetical protein